MDNYTHLSSVQAMEDIIKRQSVYAGLPPLELGDDIICGNFVRRFAGYCGDDQGIYLLDIDNRETALHAATVREVYRNDALVWEVPWSAYEFRSKGKYDYKPPNEAWTNRITRQMLMPTQTKDTNAE